MGVGRRPKTEAQRSIDGSKVRPKHREVVQPQPVAGEPTKPPYLNELASAKWDEIVDQLRQEGRLYCTDGHNIEGAANLYAAAVKLQAESDATPLIAEHGRVADCHNKARMAWTEYRAAIDGGLALGQSSRARAATPRKDDSGQDASPLKILQERAKIRLIK
jgi:phage terminase small subunit